MEKGKYEQLSLTERIEICRLHADGKSPDFSYPASTAPPFTLKISPVMKPACGEHKNRMGPAISSGVPTRPKGIESKISLRMAGSFNAGATMSKRRLTNFGRSA